MAREWKDRVIVEPGVHHGEPCIKGTRVPVSIIVGSMADGQTVEEVIEAYPQLAPEDVRAALAYAADLVRTDIILPLAG
jgi:uncharacterized protein (DUF433 family)